MRGGRSRRSGTAWLATVALLAGSLACAASASAGAGDPDPNFDGDGLVSTGFGTTPFHNFDIASAVAPATGGSFYVAGGSGGDFALARFLSDGALDATFGGGDGFVLTPVGASGATGFAVTVDGSGRPLVAGESVDDEGYKDFTLVRYTDTGVPDSSFGGGDGIVTTGFPGGADDEATGVVVLGGGDILVSGTTDNDPDTGDEDFAVAAYTSTGALDPAFDGDSGPGDGLVTTDLGSDREEARGSVLIGGSKLVVVGATNPAGDDKGDFALVRYSASTGVRDTTFSGDGIASYSFSSNPGGSGNGDEGIAVAAASGGKLVAAGSAGPDNGDFAAIRVDDAGAPDAGFGTAGKAVVSFPAGNSQDLVGAVAVQADDAVLLGGRNDDVGNDGFAVTRLTNAGVLDTSFGGTGTVTTDFGGDDFGEGARGLLLAPTTITAVGTARGDFTVARYLTSNGDPDTTFGDDGATREDVPFASPSSETARSVAIQPDGKLVVAGPTNVGQINGVKGDYEFGVARYLPSGALDTSFGAGGVDGDGKVSSNFLTALDGTGSEDAPTAVALQSDGKIVVAGTATPGTSASNDFAIARYESDGDLDPTFSDDGMATTDFGGTGGDVASAVAVHGDPGDPDFRIVVSGTRRSSLAQNQIAIAAFKDDGTLDDTFAGTGKTTTTVPGYPGSAAGDMGLQADGRIVVAGGVGGFFPDPQDFALVRYETDGDPDPTFGGGDGIVTTDFAGSFDDGSSIAIRELGGGEVKIAVGGFVAPDAGFASEGGVALYDTDGSLDPAFGPGGVDGAGKAMINLSAPNNHDALRSIAFQPDGKLVASGSGPGSDMSVVRMTATGDPDTSFSGDGVATSPTGALGESTAWDIALQPDGRIVGVGGQFSPGNESDFRLVRYGAPDPPVVEPPVTQPPAAKPKAKAKKCKKAKKRSAAAAKKKCKKKRKK